MAPDLPQNLWPNWLTYGKLGQGGFGAVYEIRRDVMGQVDRAALKVIPIPQQDSDLEYLRAEGYDDAAIAIILGERMKRIIKEYKLMSQLKGHANVVYCDDFNCVQKQGSLGWNIYIKMELLTPVMKLPASHFTQEEVIRLGIDMCRALELCRENNIIHRDIKPQNIFQARDGNYKLGDFGIAKSLEHTAMGTVAGTYQYMPPEIFKNQPYGFTVDIYSLGLVLHWLLNERRGPFLPLPPNVPRQLDLERALAQRLSGVALPAPVNGSAALKSIVQKACAFSPEERFASARELRLALEALDTGSVQAQTQRKKAESVQMEDTFQVSKIKLREEARHVISERAEKTTRYISYLEEVTGASTIYHYDSDGNDLCLMSRTSGPVNSVYITDGETSWVSTLPYEMTLEPGKRRMIREESGRQKAELVYLGFDNSGYRLEYGSRAIDISVRNTGGQTDYSFSEQGTPVFRIRANVDGIPPRQDGSGVELMPLYTSEALAPLSRDVLPLLLATPWLCFAPAVPKEETVVSAVCSGQCRKEGSQATTVFRDAQRREICTIVHSGISSRNYPASQKVQIRQGTNTWTCEFSDTGLLPFGRRREIFDASGHKVAWLEFFSVDEPRCRLCWRDHTILIHTSVNDSERIYQFFQDDNLMMELSAPKKDFSGNLTARMHRKLEPALTAMLLAFPDLRFPLESREQYDELRKLKEKTDLLRSAQQLCTVPEYRQQDEKLSFETCLSMVLASFGKAASPEKIHQQVRYYGRYVQEVRDKSGLFDHLGKKYGLTWSSGFLDSELKRNHLILPTILLDGSYAVLQGLQNGFVYLIDPLQGELRLTPEEFAQKYSYRICTFTPSASFRPDAPAAKAAPQAAAPGGRDLPGVDGCPPEKIYAFYLSRLLASCAVQRSWQELSKGHSRFLRPEFDRAAKQLGLNSWNQTVSGDALYTMNKACLIATSSNSGREMLLEGYQNGVFLVTDGQGGRREIPSQSMKFVDTWHIRTFRYISPPKKGIWPFR